MLMAILDTKCVQNTGSLHMVVRVVLWLLALLVAAIARQEYGLARSSR
jgi:hypothetical protein